MKRSCWPCDGTTRYINLYDESIALFFVFFTGAQPRGTFFRSDGLLAKTTADSKIHYNAADLIDKHPHRD